jgi:hypothetical protein
LPIGVDYLFAQHAAAVLAWVACWCSLPWPTTRPFLWAQVMEFRYFAPTYHVLLAVLAAEWQWL